MRLTNLVLPVLALVSAVFGAGTSRAHNGLRRSLSKKNEVCAALDVELGFDLFGEKIIFGELDLCLCISHIPLFVQTNEIALAAAAVLGPAKVEAELEALITSSPNNVPACPSGLSLKKKSKVKRGVKPRCPAGKSACGVYGGSAQSFECIDTQSDLESCGGCALNLNPLAAPTGVDCTTLPGVADVSCQSGHCAVHRCMAGYVVDADGTACVKAAPAAAYGLDHIPVFWKG